MVAILIRPKSLIAGQMQGLLFLPVACTWLSLLHLAEFSNGDSFMAGSLLIDEALDYRGLEPLSCHIKDRFFLEFN